MGLILNMDHITGYMKRLKQPVKIKIKKLRNLELTYGAKQLQNNILTHIQRRKYKYN